MSKPKHVLIINNVPAPYLTPLFARLGREPEWRVTVCYVTPWNPTTGWDGRTYNVRPDGTTAFLSARGNTSAIMLYLKARSLLDQANPDWLLCYGYNGPAQIAALRWAVGRHVPFAVVGDANFYADALRSPVRRMAKTPWLHWVIRRAAALVTVGTANRLFWQKYGARDEQLVESCFAVDNQAFASGTARQRAAAWTLRRLLGLDDRVVFLYVGRLIARKNVDVLMDAVSRLDSRRCALVVVGDGPERVRLGHLAGQQENVIFAGRVRHEKLPIFYAMGDCLILPSHDEAWGLVINEAMAAGLAVIAHKHCGAAVDLVDNSNGRLLDTIAADEVAAALNSVADDARQLAAMKAAARSRIEAWNLDRAAGGIAQAIRRSLHQ